MEGYCCENKRYCHNFKCAVIDPQADLEQEVHTACGSDMMSDVFGICKDQSALITGLTNPQVVRTAEMMDMICIIFVHDGKHADDHCKFSSSTKHCNITNACIVCLLPGGMLYQHGLRGGG